ncbi:MAG: branched-chain amino acid ABC transporter permease [Actinomycetota bacterium]
MGFFRTWFGKLALAAGICAILWFLGGFLSDRKAFNPYYFRILMLVGIAIILSVSLNLVNGVTGQFSIGHAGFMALGGYAAAALTVYGQYRFFPRLDTAAPMIQQGVLLLAMLVGGLSAAVAGFLVGLPSLRLRGDYLAIVTLGFGEIIRVAILNIEAVGGAAGFSGYASPHGRVTIPQLTTFFWIYGTAIVLILFSRNLLRSTHGLAFFSIREDEIAAEAMGVGSTRLKVTAFVISAFFAGVAGALYAHYEIYLQPESFGFLRSIEIVTMVVLGGMGSVTGAVIGGALLGAMPDVLRIWLGQIKGGLPKGWSPDLIRQFLYALLLVVLMLTRPQGLLGARELSLTRLFSRRRRQSGQPLSKT